MTSVVQRESDYIGRAVAVHHPSDTNTDLNDEDAAHLTCLSKIGQEILLFLSTTEVAVQQINSGSAMSSTDAAY